MMEREERRQNVYTYLPSTCRKNLGRGVFYIKAFTINLPTFHCVCFVPGCDVTSQGKILWGWHSHRYQLRCNLGEHTLSVHHVKRGTESSDLTDVCEPCPRSRVSNWTASRCRPEKAKHLWDERAILYFQGFWGVIRRKQDILGHRNNGWKCGCWEQARELGERAQTCQSGTEESSWSPAGDKLGPIAWHLACQWPCWRLSSRRMEDDGGFCPWVVAGMKVGSANHCDLNKPLSVFKPSGLKRGQ